MNSWKWLHMSDIHFNLHQFESDSLRHSLLEYIRKLNLSVNKLIITGDFRYAPNKDFEKGTAHFIRQTLDVLNLTIKQLYIVPGNHDINRSVERKNTIENIFSSYNPSNGDISKRYLKFLYEDRKQFNKFVKQIYYDEPDILQLYSKYSAPHFLSGRILHIDTTLLSCVESNDEYGKLLIGSKLLKNALESSINKPPIMAIGHHSLNSLRDDEYFMVHQILREYDIHIYLCGHNHRHEISDNRQFDFEYQLLQVFSGNLHYSEINPQIGFLIGKYELNNNRVTIESHNWDCSSKSWMPNTSFGKSQHREDAKNIFVIDSVVHSVEKHSYAFKEYIQEEIEKEYELLNNTPSVSFANLILAERNLISKMCIIYRFSKPFDIFYDASVIMKCELARLFNEHTNLLNKDEENVLLTACLLYSCKRSGENANVIKSSEYLGKLGFSTKFRRICEFHNRNHDSNGREKLGEILRLIDIFGEDLIDKPERLSLPIALALRHLQEEEKDNMFLADFVDFVCYKGGDGSNEYLMEAYDELFEICNDLNE